MTVANETILKRMMQELERAKALSNNEASMKKHIENVLLLGELIVGEAAPVANRNVQQDLEMRAMTGAADKPFKEQLTTANNPSDSIFDF